MIDGPEPDDIDDGEESEEAEDPDSGEGGGTTASGGAASGQPIKSAVRTGVMQRPPTQN